MGLWSTLNRAVSARFKQQRAQDLQAATSTTVPTKSKAKGSRGRASNALALPSAKPILPPLAGRSAECSAITGLIESAVAGQGAILVLQGAPGIGKTRLAEQAAVMADERKMLTLSGRAVSEPGVPFAALAGVLEDAAFALDDQSLRDTLGDHAVALAAIAPALHTALAASDHPAAPTVLAATSQRTWHGLQTASAQWLRRLAAAQPCLITLQDMQHADAATAALLVQWATLLEDLPVLLVLTVEDDFAPNSTSPVQTTQSSTADLLGELSALPWGHTISPEALRGEDVAQILTTLAGAGPPPQVATFIHEETQGNPLYVRAVFHQLNEEQALLDGAGQWHTQIDTRALVFADSATLVIQRRLRRLDEATRQVLDLAAIAGLHFDPEVTRRASALSGEAWRQVLDTALDAHLIEPASTRGRAHLRFAHAVIRRAIIGRMGEDARTDAHQKLAESELSMHPLDERSAARIAHHLQCARARHTPAQRPPEHPPAPEPEQVQPQMLVELYQRAGIHAARVGDQPGAQRLLIQALGWLPGESRTRPARAVLLQHIAAVTAGQDWAQAQPLFAEALTIFEQLEQPEQIAAMLAKAVQVRAEQWLGDDVLSLCLDGIQHIPAQARAHRARGLCAVANAHADAGQMAQARVALEEAVQLIQPSDSASTHLELALSQLRYHWLTLNAEPMLDAATRALTLTDNNQMRWVQQDLLGWRRAALALLGRGSETPHTGEASPLPDGNHDPTIAPLACALSDVSQALATGQLADGERAAAHALLHATDDNQLWCGAMYAALGQTQMFQGRWDEARAAFESAVACGDHGRAWEGLEQGARFLFLGLAKSPDAFAAWASLSARLPAQLESATHGQLVALAAAAEGLSALGRLDQAAALHPVLAALANSERLVLLFQTGLVHKSAGIAASAGEHYEAAQTHFELALAQAHSIPLRIEQAETRRWFARMLIARNGDGDRVRARELLQQAIDIYESCAMDRHGEIARGILNQFS